MDLASFTLFRRGMIMITDSMNFFLKPSLTKICFKHTQNVFQDILESPKGNLTIADLRYGVKYSISPSTLIFVPIKGLLGIYTLHIPPEVLYKLALI